MPPRRLHVVRTLACIAVAIVCGLPQFARGEDYLLNQHDRVRVMIVEWDLDDLRSPINGEFTISADGYITLPLLGQIDSAGHSTQAVAQAISSRLQEKLDLKSAPITTIEVMAHRPVYVLGDVRNAGATAFTPGMTVLHALALAGGLTVDVQTYEEARRQALVADDELAAMKVQRDMLRAKDARLAAEFSDLDSPEFAADLTREPADEAKSLILNWESSIFSTRREFENASATTYDEVKNLSTEQVAILEEHAAAVRRQQDAVRSQLTVVSTLRDRGLGSSARETELERALTDLESKEQEVLGRIVQVKQDAARLDEQRAGAENLRRIEVAAEFQATRKALDELDAKIATAERLMSMSEPLSNDGGPYYIVTRSGEEDAPTEAWQADEWSALMPGDILQVFKKHLPDRVASRLSPPRDGREAEGESLVESHSPDDPVVLYE